MASLTQLQSTVTALFAILCFKAVPLLSKEYTELDADVLILGAGMAGISAGKTLSDSGETNFLILEGGDDIGGRVKAVQFGGVTIELGANWIQGLFSNGSAEKNPLWPLKEKFDLEGNITNFFDLIIYRPNGLKVGEDVVDNIFKRFNASVSRITKESLNRKQKGHSDLKLRSALRFAGWHPQSSVEKFAEWFRTDFCFAERPEVTSMLANYPQYTYKAYGPYEYFVSDPRGYSTIIKGLANEYLTPNYESDPRLHLKEVVKKIEWKECCVCVTVERSDRSNRTYCAKTAIHTFSLGTLQAGTVEFVPQLPEEKHYAISILDMAYYLKVFVEFPYSFWDDAEYVGFGTYRKGYYPVFQPLNVGDGKFFPPNTPVLLFTVITSEAVRVSTQPKNITMSEIHQLLQTMYGEGVPAPIDIYVPDWIQNPLFHGTFSNYPADLNDEIYKNFLKPLGTLVFSGEATSEDYAGFVHGAYLSGIDGAHQALDFFNQCSSNLQKEEKFSSDSQCVSAWTLSAYFVFCVALHCVQSHLGI
jgi:polyamine oxidase